MEQSVKNWQMTYGIFMADVREVRRDQGENKTKQTKLFLLRFNPRATFLFLTAIPDRVMEWNFTKKDPEN